MNFGVEYRNANNSYGEYRKVYIYIIGAGKSVIFDFAEASVFFFFFH